MLDRQVILVGGFSEIIELCEEAGREIVGIFDTCLPSSHASYPLLGTDAAARKLSEKYGNIPVIVTPDDPTKRKELVGYYSQLGFSFGTLVHPSARISRTADIGRGVVIQSGVNVSSNVSIGAFVKLNTNANLMHDTKVGSFATIAPNAVVLGRVNVDEAAYIGSNATILPGLSVGRCVIVGAGAVLTRSVGANKVVAGNPARELSRRKEA